MIYLIKITDLNQGVYSAFLELFHLNPGFLRKFVFFF